MLMANRHKDDPSEIASFCSVDTFVEFFGEFGASSILILSDEDLDTDRRVQSQIEAARRLGIPFEVVDVREVPPTCAMASKLRIWLASTIHLINSMLWGLARFSRFRDIETTWNVKDYDVPIADWRLRSLDDLSDVFKAGALANAHRAQPDLVVANNLIGLLVGRFLAARNGCRVFYDAHEVTVFRNRRVVTRLRNFLAFAIEGRSSRAAAKIVTVNKPCADILEQVTGRTPVGIIYNDHFRASPVPPAACGPATTAGAIFFGSAAAGRRLELLSDLICAGELDTAAFFVCGDETRQHAMLSRALSKEARSRSIIRHGIDYDSALDELLHRAGVAWFSWIAIENKALSYNLSLPNKFFQSISSGLPIVCQEGTYLADVVRRYDIGIMIPEQVTVAEAAKRLNAARSDYPRLQDNIFKARSMILSGV